MRPPARRGHSGLRPGGNVEVGIGKVEWGSGYGEFGMRKWEEGERWSIGVLEEWIDERLIYLILF